MSVVELVPFRSGAASTKNTGITGGSSSRIDKNNLRCTHCGMTRHTKDTCFRLVGYPEWWEDNHKEKEWGPGSRVPVAMSSLAATCTSGGNGNYGEEFRLQEKETEGTSAMK